MSKKDITTRDMSRRNVLLATTSLAAASALGAAASVEKLRQPDPALVQRTLGTVWWRRVAYFSMLAMAAVFVAWPCVGL